ncbi:MAG TPA: four helix bundle protein [Gemmatimonadales bacterium]|nr:four helix bundle protein [Gemmatimonadales bacterium]
MRDHKSILAWQEAHKVTDAVFDGARTSWKPFAAAVFAQLQRAALSVQLNIAEGYALRSSRRFRNQLEIAYGSAVETGELLELAIRKQILPEGLSHTALDSCQRCQRLLLGLIKRYRDNEA